MSSCLSVLKENYKRVKKRENRNTFPEMQLLHVTYVDQSEGRWAVLAYKDARSRHPVSSSSFQPPEQSRAKLRVSAKSSFGSNLIVVESYLFMRLIHPYVYGKHK